MDIHLQLYSILREKLPPESNGRAMLQLEAGSTLGDILAALEITRKVVISVNGVHVSENSYPLKDGDQVKIFSSISGG